MNIKLGVIFGGVSVEHEVSVISAVQAMQAIDKEKYDVIPIYITKDRQWYTGEILKDMDTYTDMDLLKRYTSNVPRMIHVLHCLYHITCMQVSSSYCQLYTGIFLVFFICKCFLE